MVGGQESNDAIRRQSKTPLAIPGIDGQIAHGATFQDDRFPDLEAALVLTNPPFNVSEWDGKRAFNDKRRQYGAPSTGNAQVLQAPVA